ncbi:MAG: peptidoglycan-associated lipoprotein Pal [Gammaproteobacteria bacterium]|nr:peptidoglycan-associated lipoprotein Pal [Gammaproteobacteria bacterium]
MKKLLTIALSVTLVGMMTGCTDGMYTDPKEDAADAGYAYTKGLNGSPTFVGSNGTGKDAEMANQYYFAYDSSELTSEAKTEISKHAKYLLEHPSVKVRVEGHTDERGSREYNVALGERRAKAVSGSLANEGVLGNQVAVVSYGEEKPAVQGHDESAYQWNRRAKLVYEQG